MWIVLKSVHEIIIHIVVNLQPNSTLLKWSSLQGAVISLTLPGTYDQEP